MNKSFVRAAVFAVSALSAAVAAAASPPLLNRDAMQKARADVQALAVRASNAAKLSGSSRAVAGGGAGPAEAYVNTSRAYPTSCLDSPISYGLFLGDPNRRQARIVLAGDPNSNDADERTYSETVTITAFRVPCNAGHSATLLEIDRDQDKNGNTARYPTLPGVYATQGNVHDFAIRYADDPNTFFANNYPNTPLYISDVFVLEHFFQNVQINYNQAFTLTIDNFASSGNLTDFSMPVYNPAQYADAALPLPVSGHMSTNWSSQEQNGEGLVLQVYDNGDAATRTASFEWFTYDNNHLPFWLIGQLSFPIGTRTLTMPTYYLDGGVFAPATSVPAANLHTWGTVVLNFPDCNTVTVNFNGNATAAQGPTGSGNRTFKRVAYVNGVVCI